MVSYEAWNDNTPRGGGGHDAVGTSKDAAVVVERRAVLHTQGSADHDGTLEDSRQHGPAAQQPWG